MNWLAHLHLSDPTPAFRLGSLLPDILARPVLDTLPAEFRPGIDRHIKIDVYTDSHPIFRRSVQRLQPPYRRFGGILVDVYYDHFLASHWDAFALMPLDTFTTEVYATFDGHAHLLPETACARLQQMKAEDWLGSYREIDGITSVLGRIGRRLKRPFDLAASMHQFQASYTGFREDFNQFYPQLQTHVRS